ncbi:MAG: hypothetical protein R3E67_06525 [Pseudomonadales bacterium]
MADFVCGANEDGFHLVGGELSDLPLVRVEDISAMWWRVIPVQMAKATLVIKRGIEVGIFFNWATAYIPQR